MASLLAPDFNVPPLWTTSGEDDYPVRRNRCPTIGLSVTTASSLARLAACIELALVHISISIVFLSSRDLHLGASHLGNAVSLLARGDSTRLFPRLLSQGDELLEHQFAG